VALARHALWESLSDKHPTMKPGNRPKLTRYFPSVREHRPRHDSIAPILLAGTNAFARFGVPQSMGVHGMIVGSHVIEYHYDNVANLGTNDRTKKAQPLSVERRQHPDIQ